MNVEQIKEFLNQFNFDLRVHKDARWIDQKCTPDVVSIIADCVWNFVENSNEGTFTVNDIWNSSYFTQNVMELFSKPHPDNPTASSEYDKFIQQPLRMLAYAHVLSFKKRGSTNYYTIENLDILEFIAAKDRNAFKFIYEYIKKVLSDSGLFEKFEDYKEAYLSNRAAKQTFTELKTAYENFILEFTPINQTIEIRRIFSKVLNPYAVANGIAGTKLGRMSDTLTTFSDLMYNQVNWRDVGKEKHLTRQEYDEIAIEPKSQAITRYLVQKAKKMISRKYQVSEVQDKFAVSDSFQVHHIFPENEYPHLAAYLENLINLSPTQHYSKAHPNNNTHIIDKDYQLICLLAKSNNIQISLSRGEDFYNKGNFVFVINEGLYVTNLVEESVSFDAIDQILVSYYNSN